MQRDAMKVKARKRRYLDKQKIAKFGPESVGVDMRGKNPKPKGGESPHFTGGVSKSDHGYIKVRVGPDHPLADPNGYAYAHLLVWVAAGNPVPAEGQTIHHRNEIKIDNRIENLELLTRSEHNARHMLTRQRDPSSGRLLDGVEHLAFPEVRS